MAPMRHHLPAGPVLCTALLVACSGGSKSTPLGAGGVPVELLACRARTDSPYQFAEIALRSGRNLGTARIADRTGTERNVRLHGDGKTVVFARERTAGAAESRELFTATTDGSAAELRLTQNNVLDDEPCWSPDGGRVLFTSTRSGDGALWLCDADGTNPQPFVTPPTGETDGEADWNAATDRIVFSRRAANGRHVLWLAHGDGTGITPLTDGGLLAGTDVGDRMPAFAPDGATIAFVRRSGSDSASLCLVDVTTFTVATLLQPIGDVALPRFAPAADRLFFGLAEPTLGRPTLRLSVLPLAGGEATLLWPDQRWRLEGFDVAATLPPAPAANAPVPAPVTDAQIQVASGSAAFGARQQLVGVDGDEFVVWTQTLEGREIAGINCRFDLPVAAAEDVLELRVRAVAHTDRADGDAKLRMSIYNPVDERFDTVVELPGATTPQTLQFRTASLRHVTSERQLRVTVIGDLPAGATAQLRIDQVQVDVVTRAP